MKDDKELLEYIRMYCQNIIDTTNRFGISKDIFALDKDYQNSLAMNIIQIGETAGRLSKEFREGTENEMNWSGIKAMRNVFAHTYYLINIDDTWDTAMNDIPKLIAFCNIYIGELNEKERIEAENRGI